MLRSVLPASQQPALQPGSQSAKSVGELARPQPSVWPGEENEMAVCSIHGRWARVLQEKNPLHHTRPGAPLFSQALPGPSGGPGGGWPTCSNVGPPVEGRQASQAREARRGQGRARDVAPLWPPLSPPKMPPLGIPMRCASRLTWCNVCWRRSKKCAFFPQHCPRPNAVVCVGVLWPPRTSCVFFWGLRFHPQLQAA